MNHCDYSAVTNFLQRIGVPLSEARSPGNTFIPGAWITQHQVYYDPAQLEWVGDLLHESAHWALTPSEFRAYWVPTGFYLPETDYPPVLLPDTSENPLFRNLIDGCEQAVIAWSYAAAISIGLNPGTIHGPDHFDGEWDDICVGLSANCHPGINNLARIGLLPHRNHFPSLSRWLQI